MWRGIDAVIIGVEEGKVHDWSGATFALGNVTRRRKT
jgi:hypothetical protein